MTISTVIELLERVKLHDHETMYRGQSDIEWPVLPSIARFAKHMGGGSNNLASLEHWLLEKYALHALPLQDLRNVSLVERLAHCQHYGLPTRLLDWSSNPLKALFFAVEDAEKDNCDGSIHILEVRGYCEGAQDAERVITHNRACAFFPEIFHERLSTQEACFVALPLPPEGLEMPELSMENYPGEFRSIRRIDVPGRSKRMIRRQLAALGVTHRLIYPDFEGIARWVMSDFSDYSV